MTSDKTVCHSSLLTHSNIRERAMKQKLSLIVLFSLLVALLLTACELPRSGDSQDITAPTPEIATPAVGDTPTTGSPTPDVAAEGIDPVPVPAQQAPPRRRR